MIQPDEEKSQALETLRTLAEELNADPALDVVQKAQALNCVKAMRAQLADGHSPEKVQWDTLIKSVETSPPLTDQVIRLGEQFGYMPMA